MLSCLLAAVLAAPSGEIAYLARAADGGSQIHVLSMDSGAVRSVGLKGAADAPRWSADGSSIAYTLVTPAGSAVHVVGEQGLGGRTLNHADPIAHGPAWSPDGTRLAYNSGRGLDAQIGVYDLATGNETFWGGGGTSLTTPAWISGRVARMLLDPERQTGSLFAARFPFDRDTEDMLVAVRWGGTPNLATTDLYVVSEHTIAPVAAPLLPSSGEYAEFVPSASADALAFDSNDGGDREIFAVSARMTFDLSNHHAADWGPVWSPAGDAIAFQSFRSGRSGIYHCAARRGGGVRAVAEFADGDCWAPAWSPDGTWIAYVSDREGQPAIYAVRTDGSERRRLSPAGISADLPQWRPQP